MIADVGLFFITTSAGKYAEAAALIPGLRQLPVDLPEIQEFDATAIIRAKLQSALAQHQGEFIVEDTSLYFAGLNGLPGPLIKWFLQRLGTGGLYDLVHKIGDDRAEARTCLGYAARSGEIRFFEGRLAGRIVSPRGNKGFGWDPLFQPDGWDLTLGEMDPDQKLAISMRRKALDAFLASYAATS